MVLLLAMPVVVAFSASCGEPEAEDLDLVPIPEEDETVEIDGVAFTFKAGYPIYYYSNGDVESGVLSGNHEVSGSNWTLALQNLSRVFFYESGVLARIKLSAAHQITIAGLRYVVYDEVFLYREEKFVEVVYLASNQSIDLGGTNYTLRARAKVDFHRNGSVRTATLDNGTAVAFDEAGRRQ